MALVIVYMYTFFIKKVLFLVGSSFKKSCSKMPIYAECHPIFALALPSLVTSRPTHSCGGSETTSPTHSRGGSETISHTHSRGGSETISPTYTKYNVYNNNIK